MVFGGLPIMFVGCYKKLFKYCSFSMPQTINKMENKSHFRNMCRIFLLFTPNSGPTIWMSQQISHVLQGSTCCEFRDALLHTLLVLWLFGLLLSSNQLKAVWLFFSLFITFLSRAYLHLSRLSSTCSLLSLQFSVLCKHHSPCQVLPNPICELVHHHCKQEGSQRRALM